MIYLTFIGNHDKVNPEGPGPALTVFHQYSEKIKSVYIFQTPKNEFEDYPSIAEKVKRQIESFKSDVSVTIIPVDIIDPTDYIHVYTTLHLNIQKIQNIEINETLINLTSGTPTMTVCWVLLHKIGILPNARLIQSVDPKFRRRNKTTIEVNFEFAPVSAESAPEIVQTELAKVSNDKRILEAEKSVNDLNRSFPFLNGDTPAIREIKEQIFHDINCETHVLIIGERGTGKEMVAKSIWYLYRKPLKQSYEIFNSAGFSESLIESELFGHEKGSFTGADKLKIGIFEANDNKMIFLDEIGYLKLHCQSQLNRLIQEQTIRRVGGTKSIKVNVQVVAATNIDINDTSVFRQDLKDRFHEIISLPPLRERKSDIPLLLNHFIKSDSIAISLDDNVIKEIKNYDWPGNVRELKNWVNRLARRFPNEHIAWKDIPERYKPTATKEHLPDTGLMPDFPFDIKKFEEEIRWQALKIADNNASEADRLLNLNPGTIKAWRYNKKKIK
jgi:DNA-binding NtrC family response regulator|tara:strand:+ start:504 stop:2003 length:1500 start_codon:yes stop_codon:yes gene_type:complete